MRPRLRTLTAALVALPAVAVGLSACAPTPDPQTGIVEQRAQLSPDSNSAYLIGRYRCTGGGGVIWASIKQSGRSYDQRLEQPGSSSVATAWYDSHTPVVCDGRWKTEVFKLDRHLDKGKLDTHLTGWLQFCLTDSKDRLATVDQWEWATAPVTTAPIVR
jgi:hypothetical protein